MSTPLEELSNEELWKLFPIVLTGHNPLWEAAYLEEEANLEQVIGKENIAEINHIGSTRIPRLITKPTIDILIELKNNTDIEKLRSNMKYAGYIGSSQPDKPPPHLMFLKGYTVHGFTGQTFHVHIRYSGDWDEIYFCQYLLQHEDAAIEYGRLKLELMRRFKHDRDAYTQGKTDFIKNIIELARREKKS